MWQVKRLLAAVTLASFFLVSGCMLFTPLSHFPSHQFSEEGLQVTRLEEEELLRLTAGEVKPEECQELRKFEYCYPLTEGDVGLCARLPIQPPGEGLPEPRPGEEFEPRWGLGLFVWGLADYPEHNVLLEFVPQPELTLAAYNAALASGAAQYGVVAARQSGEEASLVFLAGFPELSQNQVEEYHHQALEALRQSEQRYLQVPLEGVVPILEYNLQLTLEELGNLLLSLAQATQVGRFQEVYQELLPQGLEKLVEWLDGRIHGFYRERIPAYIRELALAYAREAAEGEVSPQGAGGLVGVVVSAMYSRLVELVFNALYSLQQELELPDFSRTLVVEGEGRYEFLIDGYNYPEISIHWDDIEGWLYDCLADYGPPPNYPRPPVGGWDRLLEDTEAAIGDAAARGNRKLLRQTACMVELAYAFRAAWTQLEATLSEHERAGFFHLLLKACHHANEALTREPYRAPGNRWVLSGAISMEQDEIVLVMYRELPPEVSEKHRDVAVISINNSPVLDSAEAEEVFSWVETTVDTFQSPRWSQDIGRTPIYWPDEEHPIPRHEGLDLAVVVFPRELTGEEKERVRELAHRLREMFPQEPADSWEYQQDAQDNHGQAIFLIWWEDGEVWFSYIELGPGEISEENKHQIVQGIVAGDYAYPQPPINEYHEDQPSVEEPPAEATEESDPYASSQEFLAIFGGDLDWPMGDTLPVSLPLVKSP